MRFLIAGATDPNGKRRILAVKTLARIGQAAAPAKPSVLAALKDELGLVRVYAATALGKLGEIDVAVSELVAILPTSTFPPDRVAAAEGVRQIGQKAKAAGEALVQVLIKDEDKSVRAAAADALGAFGSEGTFAVRPLSDASKDQDVAVRYFAARSLKKIQP
jgi:HEAT repeat protein